MKRRDANAMSRQSSDTLEADSTVSLVQLGETLEEINTKTPDLRDYFAAKAMQALATPDVGTTLIARTAYSIADAMLEARKK